MNIVRSRVAAVAAGTLIVVGLGATSGYAAATITSADIRDNTIQSRDIGDGSVREADLSDWVNTQLSKAGTPGPRGATGPAGPAGPAGPQGDPGLPGDDGLDGQDGAPGAPGADGQDGADGASAYEVALANGFSGTPSEWLASLRGERGEKGETGEPGDPASDTKGALAVSATSPGLQTINKIGGTYSTNATTLFTLDLPAAGTYLLSANGFFDRLNEGAVGYVAPDTDTYLQLTVRGAGLGATCFTPAVSPKGFTETTCDAASVVTVDGPTTLSVRGFGYNENRSGFGGEPNTATPQFSVFAQVSAVRVG